MDGEIIVIGAGASGLNAAKIVAAFGKKVIVLEARNRIGGRIYTIHDEIFDDIIEAGAEFIHGNLSQTQSLLAEAGLIKELVTGTWWQNKEGKLLQENGFTQHYDLLMQELNKLKEDKSIHQFLETHFSEEKYRDFKAYIYDYVQGYYAGDIERASAFYLKEELLNSEEEQFRLEKGYGQLLKFLYQSCHNNGCQIFLSAEVTAIQWQKNHVQVTTADKRLFIAQQVIITVPLGILQTSSITFAPDIPEKKAFIQQLGYGAVVKILIRFDTPFWKTNKKLTELSFILSDEDIPTWWTQQPKPSSLLTGWCAGQAAEKLKNFSDNEIFEIAVKSITAIFNYNNHEIREIIKDWKVFNWASDPFTKGGYTYVTVETKKVLQQLSLPTDDTIFFGGEAFYDGIEVGTVEAALQSGKKVAEAVMKVNDT